MSEIYKNLYLLVLFVSVVLSEDCHPCQCDKYSDTWTITCIDEYKPITSIPDIHFRKVVEWEAISIMNHNLQNLPKNAFQNKRLTTLAYIIINKCKLNTIHEEAFNNVTNLIDLNLSENSLSTLPDNLFKPIKNVKYLNLQNNELKSINDKIFEDLTNLYELDLSNNLISSFSENALLNNKNVSLLYLNNNHLNSLNIEVIETIGGLQQLKISNNPWTCDCFIQKLLLFMRDRYNKNTSNYKDELRNTKCSAPESVKGVFWNDANFNENRLHCYLSAIKQKEPPTATVGGKIKLNCKVKSTGKPIEMWKFGNKNIITSNKKYELSTSRIDQVQYWYHLEIRNVTQDDEGTYKCILKNNITGQDAEAEIYLTVHGRPSDVYNILIIIGVILFALGLVLILFKCAIKWHIISHTKEDLPNFQENISNGDDSSIASLKIELQ